MAEEFDHGGVCGGSNWWSSPRNLFSSSPCSSATNGTGSFGWRSSHELNMDMKTTRSSDNSAGSVSACSPTILRAVQKFQQRPTADDWINQDLRHDIGRSDENYSQIEQASGALNSSMNYRHQTRGVDDCNEIDKWNSQIHFCGDFSVNAFKRESQIGFSLQPQPLDSITECTETCQGLTTNFPLNSTSYSYTSTLLRTLFHSDSYHSRQTMFDNQEINYLSATNFSHKPYVAKQQSSHRLHFSNNTPFWNAAAAPPDFIPSTPSKYLTSSHNNFPSTSHDDQKLGKEESKNLASVAKKSISKEPAFKHPRLETPLSLPTFKVRKEKLGDRITALQQLVSPFGKTDTASVLHEAIEYIKLLHDQVNVFSTPYLKNGSPPLQHQQDQEGLKQDLSSRGLCLVPISSTFPVAAEKISDFWTPTSGRSSESWIKIRYCKNGSQVVGYAKIQER
ncbi:uncharacterized protein [Primulina huaijiensis]|uniref:uncharacterized protein n=1 Tax=Primulina huaijiensis TaxID=1492673 RepID=UPI003CC722A9